MSAIDPAARVHPSADVEPGVSIGPRTAVWHRAQIRQGARVGADCVIGGDVFIDVDVQLGNRVKVQNGALVYHGVTVCDGVFIGPGAILTNDRHPRAVIATGELAAATDWTISPITLNEGCSIGAAAIVIAGCDIGAWAMVGAGAVVTKSVRPYALVVGNPGRSIGWVCRCGQRLLAPDGQSATATVERLDDSLHCGSCGRAYATGAGVPELIE